MTRQWTFGQRLGAGFAVIVLLALAAGTVSTLALRRVVDAKDAVISRDMTAAVAAERLRSTVDSKVAALRGYLLSPQERFLESARKARAEFTRIIDGLRPNLVSSDGTRTLQDVITAEQAHEKGFQDIIAISRGGATGDAVSQAFDDRVVPLRDELQRAIGAVVAVQTQRLEAARADASATAEMASNLVIGIVIATVVIAVLLSFILARSLTRQVGTAIGQIQSSSAELQAAANQQATGAKEQASAMNEISTTISELLATSRQIYESAQRVAEIAGQTAASARAGDGTVEKAHQSVETIRRQVDQIVNHMLELGKKSQEIGGVLDLVSELAEQTNILAINATIEAAGAGEAGKRFAVVADEIRKLADRVGGSTKQIRVLIDDVRGAVNTTVMATETGAKAVDAGSRQFNDVAAAFRQITGLVSTTTDAGREIELSTKQQTTAVEQVNVAIASVAQATKENEASSGQTLATASQLAQLSTELTRLVRTQTTG